MGIIFWVVPYRLLGASEKEKTWTLETSIRLFLPLKFYNSINQVELVKPHGRLHLFRRPLSCPGLPQLPQSGTVIIVILTSRFFLPFLYLFVFSVPAVVVSSFHRHIFICLTLDTRVSHPCLRLPTKASPVSVSQSVLGRTFVDKRDWSILSYVFPWSIQSN